MLSARACQAMESEEWKDVVGYEGLYQVSSLGNVRRDGRILKNQYNSHGYKHVVLRRPHNERKWGNHGVGTTSPIHRLVALAFIPNPENKQTVDHINRDKADNRIENLRWATSEEQQQNRDWTPGLSGYKYIVTVRTNCWRFMIIRNKQVIVRQFFNNLDEAVRGRDEFLK